MATLKKISFLTLSLCIISTHSVMSSWFTPKEQQTIPFWESPKKEPGFDAQIDAMSESIKNNMSDKTKLLVGVGTLGTVGGWFIVKITKKALAMVFYASGLAITGAVVNSLLKDIEFKKVVPEIFQDIKDIGNTVISQTAQATKNLNDMINSKPKN